MKTIHSITGFHDAKLGYVYPETYFKIEDDEYERLRLLGIFGPIYGPDPNWKGEGPAPTIMLKMQSVKAEVITPSEVPSVIPQQNVFVVQADAAARAAENPGIESVRGVNVARGVPDAGMVPTPAAPAPQPAADVVAAPAPAVEAAAQPVASGHPAQPSVDEAFPPQPQVRKVRGPGSRE